MKEEYKELAKTAETLEESIRRLNDIISILRKECPWDREQTHYSLRSCMLEEAYEVVDAIEKEDFDNLEEELGDVLLQVVFHSNLAEEEDKFVLKDVINLECEKMIRRHPHVFLEEMTSKSGKPIDKILEKWENIKAWENNNPTSLSLMEKVPKALPALTRAAKLQKKAASVGFDWEDVQGAFDKIKEETEELIEASCNNGHDERVAEELGDLLFSVVNAARFLKVDPEDALNSANKKFIRRFAYIESQCLACGKQMDDMSLAEMDQLWEQAKKTEKNKEK
jgi:tetrapyrrole methylase family protein/MazG family protein